ncbi:transcription termination factor Rho [Nocardia yamanashiensis]|uniref:transcription termination factor Rho n=1 Tax=Nocardia yamanashiensis TaxID=209247 RepID=UPI001E626F94|nr:transcription termination factor Rho [Nocardia yamanashiensis]UGT39398.1 transcription termination factor Rho [Nocardia yamanashiensis]
MTDTDLLATPGVESQNSSGSRESESGQISKMSEQTDVARSGLTPAKAESAPARSEAPKTEAKSKAEVKTEAPAEVRENASEARESKRDEAGDNARAEGGDDNREGGQRGRGRQRRGREQRAAAATANAEGSADAGEKTESEGGERRRDRDRNQQGERNQGGRDQQGDRQQGERNQNGGQQNGAPRGDRDRDRDRGGDDDERGGRRGRRFRERRRGRDRDGGVAGGGESREREPELREDDVLQPVAGILDVLDNYAFVRTSGYLAGPNDVYVSMNLVRKNGLRRGDAITGAVRAPRDGDQSNQRQKFDPLVRLDTVNGADVESAKRRPEFSKLTPLYPNQRLRLETQPNKLTTRIIDLIMPIGKGQRALIVSPPKAGKTTIMQDIANAISVNNPECYLMVVLVDERPEEVTDMQRSVRGEVIASTFDRPPSDHTSVAELAIERAKRLVEAGQDVVVLLDSITRLGRAYNNSSPASGRILSGGVDSTALYPPKRFLGAARNIENGGSLTIIATAMVETGSTGDTVIFEEFKGTGNAELKLDRKIAERRVFPAVDVNPSGTRRDDLLMSADEAAVLHKLRRVLSGLDSHQAIDLLVDRLKKTKSNVEFLMTVSKTAPGAIDE